MSNKYDEAVAEYIRRNNGESTTPVNAADPQGVQQIGQAMRDQLRIGRDTQAARAAHDARVIRFCRNLIAAVDKRNG